ncbi:MAG: hypothetical protein ACHQCH_06575 [Solirubrobacterales bacterium]
MSGTEQRQIDWASAEIKDRVLTVRLTGKAGRGWAMHFNGVLGLLEQNAARWGEITVRKDTIEVADVQEGSERDLRHLLESALLQVNADFEPNLERDAPEAERDPERTIDHGMSDTFRGFADSGD